VLHVDAATPARVACDTACELVVAATANPALFAPRLFDVTDLLESEHRGRGLLDDTAYRIVRTVFDRRNRPEANLVVGEVVNFPGRWSSYPPHHHAQPEIYHYRFTEPHGYGHGEIGDRVLKIRQFDTLKILDQLDHSQVAAPGYGMYYVWVIRHLPGDPYTGPEFTAEHRWTTEPQANRRAWRPALDDED
jgi:5-deoxy-D-glucuronate isomerase